MTYVIPVNVQVPTNAAEPMTADFLEHALQVAYFQLRYLIHLADSEWAAPGVYLLLSDDTKDQVFVGHAGQLKEEIDRYCSVSSYSWRSVIAIKRYTTAGFTSAEASYLAGRLVNDLAAASGLSVVHLRADQSTTLSANTVLALDAILPSMLAAIRLGGVAVHEESDVLYGAGVGGSEGSRMDIPGKIADLLAAGLLYAGAELHLSRRGERWTGIVSASGMIVVDGVSFAAPSAAAMKVLGGTSTNGWRAWHVGDLDGPTLADLRAKL